MVDITYQHLEVTLVLIFFSGICPSRIELTQVLRIANPIQLTGSQYSQHSCHDGLTAVCLMHSASSMETNLQEITHNPAHQDIRASTESISRQLIGGCRYVMTDLYGRQRTGQLINLSGSLRRVLFPPQI